MSNTWGDLLLIFVAELALRQKELLPGFSLSLLQIVANPSYKDTHLASALYFKNLIRRKWTVCHSCSLHEYLHDD